MVRIFLLIVCFTFVTVAVEAFVKGKHNYASSRQMQQEDNTQQNRGGINRRNNFNPQKGFIPDRIKRLQQIKVSFITTQLQPLTPAQYDKFWPLYNQYQAEMFAAQKERRLNNSNAQANGQKQLDNEIAIDQKIVDIRKHYNAEFQKILPPEKVSLIYKSEKQFNDEALKQLQERKKEADN